ncbi:Cdc6/Cdc18 family protein [Natrinema hispanicum]|nr:hypothetical protein [Natrinema hispanicum]
MDIFETRRPFRDDYNPGRVVARDETIDKMGSAFQDFVDGYRPPDVCICGDSGIGKRTIIKHLLKVLQTKVETELVVTTVDCAEHNTIYKIYLALANKVCPDRYPNGTNPLLLQESIFQEMNDPDRTHFIILEHLEALGLEGPPFNDLQQARSTYSVENTECGFIGISNESRILGYLPKDVVHKSRMHTIETYPYDAHQLRSILELHAEIAFADGVLSESVIPKCAAIIAQETGQATEALQLLELSGYLALQSEAEQVTEDHVSKARNSLIQLQAYNKFTKELTAKEQLTCVIITAYNLVNGTAITPDDISRHYRERCRSFNLNQVKIRQVRNYIQDLDNKGLLDCEGYNAGRGGGIQTKYKLSVPPEPIIQGAIATSGRFKRLLQQQDVSINKFTETEEGIDFTAFSSRQ